MLPAPRFCLARHGQTDWNAAGRVQGQLDPPLNAIGREQAHALATRLADTGIVAVHSSPLSRALETAQIVADGLGLAAPTVHRDLRERHFGRYQGMDKAAIAAAHPEIHNGFQRRDPACPFAGGEALEPFCHRVLHALDEIAREYANANPNARVLIVSHGWVHDVVARQHAGLATTTILEHKCANGETLWFPMPLPSVTEPNNGPRPKASIAGQ